MSRPEVFMETYNIDNVDGYINLTGRPLNSCTDTCALTIKFYDENTKFTMKNKGDHLLFTPINTNKSNVIRFNSNEYMFKDIKIYKSSLHTYSGNPADGELSMQCVTTNNGSPSILFISIPMVVGNSTSDITKSTEKLILQGNTKVPKQNDKGITNYGTNLNNLIPKKTPFDYYKQGSNVGIIAYSVDYAIKISNSSMAIFNRTLTYKQTIPLYVYANGITQVAPVSHNPIGATQTANSGDEIYIDCKPTGEEGKKQIVLEDKPNMIGDEVKKIIAIFLKLLVAIILIRLIWFLPKLFSNSSNKSGSNSVKPPSGPKKV